MNALLAAALLAAAMCWPVMARHRRAVARADPRGHQRPAMPSPHRLLVVAVGLAPAVVLGMSGLPLGAALAVGASALLRAQPAAAPDAAGLPLVLDVLAAGLRAGAPLTVALDAVGSSGGALGPVCARLAASLRFGAHTGPEAGPSAQQLAELLLRSSRSGGAPAAALADAAAELRAAEAAAGLERARRAGVRVVLPLVACFLPAFVLVAVVPVALGLLDA